MNTDNGLSAFIVSDTPARLTPDATTLNNWGNNVNKAAVDGEQGLISTDAYAAVYYPWGYTTDLLGESGDVQDMCGEDVSFCLDAKDAGFEIWCDPRVRVGHEKTRII